MKKTIVILLTLAAAALAGKAQQTWTLQQCMDYAVEHNIQIKKQDINRLQREIDVNTARNSRLPDLSASASENVSFGRGLTADNTYSNTNTSSTSFSLGTSVPLFTGYRIPRTLELNQLNLQAATEDLEKAKNDIRTQVAQAFVQVLYSTELCDVAKRQIHIDSLQVFRITEMLRNGKASRAEQAQQEAALAQSRLTATQAEGDRSLALLNLSQLLELPSPEGFDIVAPSLSTLSSQLSNPKLLPSPDEIYADAVMVKPEVRAEQFRLEGTEKSIAIARSAQLPSVSFSAGMGTNYYTSSGFPSDGFFKQMNNNFSQYLGLNVSVPIFNRHETRNNIRAARLNQQQQELQLGNTKKALYKEIQQAYYNALTSQAQYASSDEALHSQQEAFRLMQAKYENGKANITEFNEAKNNLMKAESDLVRAKYEYVYQNALLDFYRGRPLDF